MSVKTCPNVLLLVDQRASRWSSQEDFCLHMSKRLVSNSAWCVVVYSSSPTRAVARALTDAGAVLDVACQHEMSLLGLCRKIRRLCHQYRIDVVHSHHYVPSSRLIAALALSLPCPVIVGDCTGGEGKPRRGLSRRLFHAFNRAMNGPVAGIIAPSYFVWERLVHYRGIPEQKVWHIPNGVNLGRFRRREPSQIREKLGLSSEQPLILTAGNLLPLKAVDVLLLAFARILEEYPTSMLAIVGDGPERATLEKLAQESGISSRSRFLGERSDMPDLLSASVIFCCPSIWAEAFGWVNIEAMACKVPVVSTTTGAIPEVVEDGRTGLLVPPREPNAMAAAIRELLASAERRKTMGNAGRHRVEQLFDLRRTIDRCIEVYAKIVACRSTRNSAVGRPSLRRVR